MKKDFIQKLCCPFDKKELKLQIFTEDLNNEIREGILTCNHCKRYYPIIHGIPIMSPDEYRETNLELPVMKRWANELGGNEVKNFRVLEK